MNPDFVKLENITEDFVKSLLRNEFNDPQYYVQLMNRCSSLIKEEIKNSLKRETYQIQMMQVWPKEYTQ